MHPNILEDSCSRRAVAHMAVISQRTGIRLRVLLGCFVLGLGGVAVAFTWPAFRALAPADQGWGWIFLALGAVTALMGGRLVLDRAKMKMPSIVLVWADGGYAGKLVAFAQYYLHVLVEIVRRPTGQRTFEVLPRRWVIERTLSWMMRARRLARDYERLPEHSEAFIKWSMIGLMTRRLAPAPGRRPWQPNTGK